MRQRGSPASKASHHVEQHFHHRSVTYRRPVWRAQRPGRSPDLRIRRPRAIESDARMCGAAANRGRSAADRAPLPYAQDSVCRPRPRNRVVRRSAAETRRCVDRVSRLNRCSISTSRSRITVEPGVSTSTSRAASPNRRSLRARSVEPADLLDWRQRRRKFRRRALPEVRLHRAPRPRTRGGAAERRPRASRRIRARYAGSRSGRRDGRVRRHARDRDEDYAALVLVPGG